jgi:hypothetical protein
MIEGRDDGLADAKEFRVELLKRDNTKYFIMWICTKTFCCVLKSILIIQAQSLKQTNKL